jgi:hypothetical protein
MRHLVLAIALIVSACGSDPQQPDPPDRDPPPRPSEGIIRVRADTAGSWVQAGQYPIVLDGAQVQKYLSPLSSEPKDLAVAPGTHTVSLAGLPPWCSVGSDAPLSVEVAAAAVVDVRFRVTCTGAAVSFVTSGAVPDRDGYVVVVDDAARFSISVPNGSQVIGIAPGRRVVTLDGLASHCRPARPSWEFDVTPTGPNPLRLEVTCLSARLRAEITTTGSDLDADGYVADLDTTASGTDPWTGLRGTTEMDLGALPVGTAWTVSLSEAAPNCSIDTPVRRGTMAEADTTVVLRFAVTCVPLPAPGILISMFYSDYFYGFYAVAARWLDTPTVTSPFGIGDEIGNAEWSPDGRLIAYEAWYAEGAVMVRSRDSAQPRRLGPGTQPVFAPDGQSVLFLAPTRRSILRVGVSGGAATTVLSSAEDVVAFDLSPDGSRVVMVLGGTIPTLVIANADGSDVRTLEAGVATGRPRFSPDGTEIVAQSAGRGFTPGAWFTVRPDGTGRRSVGPTESTAAAWSPDGSRIVFARQGQPNVLVSVRRADGGDERTLTQLWTFAPVVSLSWR